MYLSHFGLDEPPFRITSNTEFFFEGANRGATLEGLLYAITHDEGIVKVTGEVGSGKTMLCRVLINRLPKNVETIFLANPSLSREEILRAIAEDLRVEIKSKRTTLLLRALQEHLIQRYAEGGRVVVLIDEAHAMPSESLEEIRLLSNLESNRHKLLQIVLFGQPELDEHLDYPNMRQLKERITHSFKLEPLVRADVESYVEFRMRAAGYRGPNVFSKSALKLIVRVSQGLTRRINILCDKSLLAAFADNEHQVSLRHARAAAKDSDFRRFSRSHSAWWLAAAGMAAGLLLGIASQFAPSILGRADSNRSEERSTALGAFADQMSNGKLAELPGANSNARRELTIGPLAAAPSPADVANESVAAGIPGPTALNSQNGRTDPSKATQGANPLESKDANPPPESGMPPRWEGQSELAIARVKATHNWLQRTPAERYSIQLLTATEGDVAWMESFLRKATELVSSDDLYLYSWRVNGRMNYRVTYGTYDSVQQSLSAIAMLPAPLRTYKPYPETVAVMRQLTAQQ